MGVAIIDSFKTQEEAQAYLKGYLEQYRLMLRCVVGGSDLVTEMIDEYNERHWVVKDYGSDELPWSVVIE